MLLSRRLISPMRRNYARVIVIGVVVTLFLFLLLRVNQLSEETQQSRSIDAEESGNNIEIIAEQLPLKTDTRSLEKEIQLDLAMQRPGLGNRGVSVQLSGVEAERGEQDLAKIALNEELSKHLSYNRTPPEGRNPHCIRMRYDTKHLPTAAVIIIFYNEPYSVILRTVYSVINTASENLKEIVLVDDASTNEELLDKLEYFVATRFPKMVKLIRTKSR